MAGNGSVRRGVQSIEIGLRLARVLASSSVPLGLSSLAAAAGMAPAKAHRYLVSLVRSGLVSQDPVTGRYDLGELALHAGLTALGRLDPVRLAGQELVRLRDAIDETVALAVWSNRGGTIIRWEEASRPVTVNIRVGSVTPLINSATGRLFAALLPAAAVTPLLEAEIAALAPDRRDAARHTIVRSTEEIRRHGLARVTGDLVPGVNAMAAPIFDQQGQVALALTAVGHDGRFDAAWDGAIAAALRDTTMGLSRRLGWNGPAAQPPIP